MSPAGQAIADTRTADPSEVTMSNLMLFQLLLYVTCVVILLVELWRTGWDVLKFVAAALIVALLIAPPISAL